MVGEKKKSAKAIARSEKRKVQRREKMEARSHGAKEEYENRVEIHMSLMYRPTTPIHIVVADHI